MIKRFGLSIPFLAFVLCVRASGADFVRSVGDIKTAVTPEISAKTLPQVPGVNGLTPNLDLTVPVVPTTLEGIAPQINITPEAGAIAPTAQPQAEAQGPQQNATIEEAGALAQPEGGSTAHIDGPSGSQVFDGIKKQSVVHLHHDENNQPYTHVESYHHDESSHDSPLHSDARRRQDQPAPFPIPARLAAYVPSAQQQNPQDWTQKITLHLHSIYSDGTMTPEAVIDAAYAKGVRVVALTDHDTAAGVERAWKRVQEINAANPSDKIEFHTGIEMTAQGGAHIGALDLDLSNPKLIALLERVRIMRYQKAAGMIANLNNLQEFKDKGIVLTIDEVKAFSQHDAGGTIEIPHIARALLAHGLIKNVDDAFDSYLKGGIFSVPGVAPDPSPEEVVETIHAAGGKAFLNHPYTVRGNSDAEKDAAVEAMLELGMDGIEVYRPSHATSDNGKRLADERAAKYLVWAEKYNLLVGNGADFHGTDTHLDQLAVWMHNKYADELQKGLGGAQAVALAALAAMIAGGAALVGAKKTS